MDTPLRNTALGAVRCAVSEIRHPVQSRRDELTKWTDAHTQQHHRGRVLPQCRRIIQPETRSIDDIISLQRIIIMNLHQHVLDRVFCTSSHFQSDILWEIETGSTNGPPCEYHSTFALIRRHVLAHFIANPRSTDIRGTDKS